MLTTSPSDAKLETVCAPLNAKRILLVDLGSDYGGVEIYLDGLSDILISKADLYAICSLPRLAEQLSKKGVHVTCIPMLSFRWFKVLRLLVALAILPYYLVRYRIEAVQLNGFFESMLLPIIFLFGRAGVYTMHLPFEVDLYRWYRNPARFFPRLVSKLCVHLASQVICVSQTIGNIALQAISSRKVRVIPNWVSLPEAESKRSCAIASSVRLLFVGRLERYKGLHLLIEALRDLPGVSLTVVGDGLFRGELERLSTGLPVTFVGFQSNTARFYEDADIFVNPSLGPEGLPLVSLEAMGRGIPCLFSDLPVHCEISSDGVAAALFKTGDQRSLLEQLKRLLSNETRRRQISEKAAASVQDKYSRQVAARAYLETFELV